MIGGTLIARNVLEQDYCIKESLTSLLGFCDEVVICESESTDGTRDFLYEWAGREPRIRIVHAEWRPVSDWKGKWLADLSNFARRHLRTPYHVSAQADEVYFEHDYDQIRDAARSGFACKVRRLNFWKDAWHLVPKGFVCGHNIVRMAPMTHPFLGDAESLEAGGYPQQSEVRLAHYGFLRHTEAQIRKGISMEEQFCGTHNPIYERMKTEGRKPFDEESFPAALDDYDRTEPHPAVALDWLRERGRL